MKFLILLLNVLTEVVWQILPILHILWFSNHMNNSHTLHYSHIALST